MRTNLTQTLVAAVLVLGVFLAFSVAPASIGAATPGSGEEPQILIVIGPQYGLPMAEAITPALVSTFRAAGYSLDDIYVEFLDLHRNPGPEYRASVLAVLEGKLSDGGAGLVIAVNQGAVDFMAREGKSLLPGAPLLIPILEELPEWEREPRDIVALSSRQDAEGTLRHALELFPDTERVVLISGTDDRAAPFLAPIEEALSRVPDELQVERTSDLTYEEMLQYLSQLPVGTIAFYGSYFEDVTGRSFVPAAVAAEVGARSNVPVFAFRDQHIMQGLVGGSVSITSALGEQAARIGIDYLRGRYELAEPVTIVDVPNRPLFDWYQVERFAGDVRRLPGDTVFINRPPSLWENHGEAVVIAGFSSVLLAALVVAFFVWNRRLQITVLARDGAERELRSHKEHLEDLVTERTNELELTNLELEKATQTKSAFLANMSHELRTPLNSIIGFSGLMMQGLAGPLSEEQERQIVMVHRSGKHLLNLVNEILDIAKIESGQVSLQYDTFEPAAMLVELADAIRPLAAEKGIELVVDAPEDLAPIVSDHGKVRQVLLNLAGNAVKFTASGRVTLGASADSSGYIELVVADTGPGIPAERLEDIFEPFVQLEVQGKAKPGGTGLGLPISREFVKLLRGDISVTSEVEAGSTFTVRLPVTGPSRTRQ